MCAPIVLAAAVVASGALKATSEIQQGQAQNRYYKSLARTAELQGDYQKAIDEKQADIAEDVGSQQVKSAAIKSAELSGMQRADTAMNGMSATGSAQDIAVDSMRKTNLDEINLKYNADTKAWGFETEGAYAKWQGDTQDAQYRTAGKNALRAGKMQAGMTLLSTAISVASIGVGSIGSRLASQTAKFGGGIAPYSAPSSLSGMSVTGVL